MRELIVLGTASQAPTRERNHNGYLLRWDDEGFLFDPGEGTQRQLLLAGVPVSAVSRICITHFHGDHCLGLPGVLQRRALDQLERQVDVYFPASGVEYFERLHRASIYHERSAPRSHAVGDDGVVAETDKFRLIARRLDHAVDAIGWRVQELPGRRMLPDRLATFGISGSGVGKLVLDGAVRVGDQLVTIDEVSVPRPGQAFAFIMDTRYCEGGLALAEDADLLVCEATFLERDATLAETYFHLTAAGAVRLALRARARKLVLTHFSQRYDDVAEHLSEASAIFPDVVAAADLTRIPVPRRAVS